MAFQAAYDGVKNAAGKVNKLVNMVFGIGGTTVGALQLDALIEETTELAANVTQVCGGGWRAIATISAWNRSGCR